MANSRPSIHRGQWDRKAGVYDFDEYATLDLVNPSIGEEAIRHVAIDCRLLFEESQWGVLQPGPDEKMAGIVHMELFFHQTVDCKLLRAKVCLTLDEHDPTLKKYQQQPVHSIYSTPSRPVQITKFFGPERILGPLNTSHIKRSRRFKPEVNVGVGGGALGSLENETHSIHQSRWQFRTRRTNQDKTLSWEITEDDINKTPLSKDQFYIAFAYIHSGQPFLMKLKISGKLHRVSNRVKNFPKKLFGGFGHSKDSCVTLVDACIGPQYPRHSLDEEARSLNATMLRKNDEDIDRGSEASSVTMLSSTQSPATQFEKFESGTQLQDDEQDEFFAQSDEGWSNSFVRHRGPTPREEEECSLDRLDEAGRYFLESSTAPDPLGLGKDTPEREESVLSSSPTLVASEVSSNDAKDTLPKKTVHWEDLAEDGDIKTINRRQKRPKKIPVVSDHSNLILGLGFLFIFLLYIHLIHEMRGISRVLQ